MIKAPVTFSYVYTLHHEIRQINAVEYLSEWNVFMKLMHIL